MPQDFPQRIARGFWATSLGTLASRLLGLARDVVTAALLGLGQGGVMDALVVAFRLPNLSRRILGEGALAAGLVPVFTAEQQRDPRAGWRLLSTLLALLAVGLTGLLLAGEAVCAAGWWLSGRDGSLLWGLSAVLLPYMLLICLAAQVSAALQAIGQFRLPAFAPIVLNVCWLAAAWFVAPRVSGEPAKQAYVIAIAIVVSGVLQLGVQLPALGRAGFRFEFDWRATAPALRQIGRAMLPIALGLAVTQINTLVDSLLAVGLAARPGGSETIAWLPGALRYPLDQGAAAAIYFGERFYHLPVGLLGLATATVIYPLLSRHAARGDRAALGADLTWGLRLVWFTALPAGVGLVLLSEPATRLLFEHGAFTADDARRAAAMISCYASAAWAYCALPVLVRGYYALGNRTAPAVVGAVSVGFNLALSLALVWPLGERGLAVATAATAGVQTVVLTGIFARTGSRLAWRELRVALIKGGAATAVMAIVVTLGNPLAPAADSAWPQQALHVALCVASGAGIYLLVAWLLRMPELALLSWSRQGRSPMDRLSDAARAGS